MTTSTNISKDLFHPDHLGSSTLITDNFGDPYQFFLNLPFGETFAEQRRSGTFNNPYKFNGKEFDPETGLYYYGARYYNPRTSVFISVDPLTEQTMTPYQYTYQNPVRYIDPTGMAAEEVDDIIFKGKDNKEWRVETAGDDIIIDLPFNLNENRSMDLGVGDVDPQRFAVGYSVQVDGSFGFVAKGTVGGELSIMQFTDKKYGNYKYVYAGLFGELSAGAQGEISASAGFNLIIAYNDDFNRPIKPQSFAGEFYSIGGSVGGKFLAGGGLSISRFSEGPNKLGWKGVSIGGNISVGVGANFGAIHGGMSNSRLLNDVKPTNQRNFIDRITNKINPISSAIVTGSLDKLKN